MYILEMVGKSLRFMAKLHSRPREAHGRQDQESFFKVKDALIVGTPQCSLRTANVITSIPSFLMKLGN